MPPEQPNGDHNDEAPDALREPEAGIDYLAFVESHEFGDAKKTALDIARLLNDPMFRVTGKDRFARERQAEMREKAFNAFCHQCVKAGVEVPALERALYEPSLPAEAEASRRQTEALPSRAIIEQAESQIAGREPDAGTEDIRALLHLLRLFPKELADTGYLSRVDRKQILAVLNERLVTAGLDPVRPDYAIIKIALATDETEPKTPKKVLIVDDAAEPILDSALRLAGWPGIETTYLHHVRSTGYTRPAPKETQEKITALLERIVSQQPDVVLLDEDLDAEIKGSDLLKRMQQDPRSHAIRFVANTGGSDDAFRSAGAYSNFEKGRQVGGLRSAVLAE